jgi:WD40 repeat protein
MDCEICLEKYDKQVRIPMTIIPCGHTYCSDCLSKLKRQINKCPKCKQQITSKKPSYAVLSILDLNLVVDLNSDLKQAINETLREIKEFKAKLSVSCEQKIQESQNKINLIKEEINNKTSELMNILICNQEILFNEADNFHKNIAQKIKIYVNEQQDTNNELRTNDINLMDRQSLNQFRDELIKLKIDLNNRYNRLNQVNNVYEFKPNENLNNEMKNLIGCIFKKNFLMNKTNNNTNNNNNNSLELNNGFGDSGSISINQHLLNANKILISGSGDKTIKLWNVENGNCLSILEGHESNIECLQTISDDVIASGSMDQSIKIWNIKTKKCINTLQGHKQSVLCLLVLSDDILVSGSMDQTIKLWNIKTSQCLNTLESHRSSVWCLHNLKDILISGSGDKSIKLWDLKDGKCINTLLDHTNIVLCLQIIENMLISGSSDKTIKVWQIDNGELVNTLKGHKSSVLCLEKISNELIVSGSMDHSVKIWNYKSGVCLNTLETYNGIKCLQVLSSDTIVCGSFDHTIKFWNIKTADCIKSIRGHDNDINCLRILHNNF